MSATSLRTLLGIVFFAGASALANAQGSDSCATSQSIVGRGPHSFINSAATTGTEGQAESLCNTSGQTAVQRDVWFTWTADETRLFEVATCGGTSVNTKIAVYAGSGCPGASALACNDNSCGNQSRAQFNATAGAVYTIQLGVAFGAGGGSGTFVVQTAVQCNGSTGPDVIVGEITDVMNVAPVGTIDAIALGTTSCNVGTATLSWIASTPAHPVIRQNLHRFAIVDGAGRFEHLGLSWLKHGFTALQGTVCCTCTPNGSGSALGVGCSDPYGSGLNGGQSGAGPNYQVNAHTGVFAYPPANPSFTANTIARRCQFDATEVAPAGSSGVRLFGECQYVTADDAAAGNQNNNASWRDATFSGASPNYTIGLSGQTHRGEPAMYGWAAAETGVTITRVQISGDGLILVGSKATALGGGMWHYEFAVQNVNSERNVGRFSVPLTPGLTVTNVGFHDVAYHDNDGVGNNTFSGTDWTVTQTASEIAWETQSSTVNGNANAIRWSTLYNFRFDANAAPQSGLLTAGLWRSGAPGSVTAAGDVPGNSPFSAFCFGDGSSVACPCANNGTTGNGCANSAFSGGANLAASGNASVANDGVVFVAGNLTGAVAIFFQGDAQVPPAIVDDGIGCVGGSIVRLRSNPVGGNFSVFPDVGDPSVSTAGGVAPAGGTYFYQCFYRNSVSAFCPPATSNRTNGVQITWAP